MQTFDEWLNYRLRLAGAYSGVVDDAHGRATIEALRLFQAAVNLPATGLADAATIEALRVDQKLDRAGVADPSKMQPPAPVTPVWFREAQRLIGLRETSGTKSNPTILGWAKKLGGFVASYYKDDSIPWCGLFMGNIIATTLPCEKLPANPLGALNWAKFGRGLSAPAQGAILVFRRPGGGHVTLYKGEDATHYCCLGGNQSDSVNDTAWIEKSRLEAIRWPMTGDAPMGGIVRMSRTGAVSKDEA